MSWHITAANLGSPVQRFVEQRGQAPVTGDPDVQLLVPGTVAALLPGPGPD